MDQKFLVILELKTNRVTCNALWLWSMVNGQKHVKNLNIFAGNAAKFLPWVWPFEDTWSYTATNAIAQLRLISLKSTIETLGKSVKYVQS